MLEYDTANIEQNGIEFLNFSFSIEIGGRSDPHKRFKTSLCPIEKPCPTVE